MPYQEVLQALADPVRREMIFLLRDGPSSVGELAEPLPVSRPAVSRHLRVLEQAGLVAYEQDGTRNIYHLDRHGLGELRAWIDDLDVGEPEGNRAPIRKRVAVSIPPRRAFHVFTREVAKWWNVATHAGKRPPRRVSMDCRQGGEVSAATADGRTVWGTISLWQPPHRLVIDWHPGRPASESTELELFFAAAASHTVVELHHGGWERQRSGAAARADYEQGWDAVLAAYASVAGELGG